MPRLALAAPQPLDARTGGCIYNRRMVDELRLLGWDADVLPLDRTFPHPTAGALDDAGRAMAALPPGTIVAVDSLALGAMPDLVAAESTRLRVAALMHLPLAADLARDPADAAGLEPGERRALHAAALVIVTGAAALPLLERYELPPHRIRIVEPGTDTAPLARGARASRANHVDVLCVAALNPLKGHDVLIEALARVRDARWHLTCAGDVTRHAETAERVREAAVRLGVGDRVTFAGELDSSELEARYDRADVAVSASRQETYGMAVAEALARGLPVVATITGAAGDLLGDRHRAGLLVPPGDVDALSLALARIISDSDLRANLASNARRVRDELPGWPLAARRFAAALEGIPAHG
jgi:glycosyltransferase involved in cell wall biosynthesis